MAANQPRATALSDEDYRRQLRRAVIASAVGTTIEWYDFFLYSTVTGLVFAKLYFPESDPLVGTLQAFLIYAVGFVARPVEPHAARLGELLQGRERRAVYGD